MPSVGLTSESGGFWITSGGDLPIESVGKLREALTQAERRAKLSRRETKSLVMDPHAR